METAVEHLNKTIQNAAWNSTSLTTYQEPVTNQYPLLIREKIAEQRKLRRLWQNTRSPYNKRNLNRCVRHLTSLIKQFKNETLQHYLQGLPSNENTY